MNINGNLILNLECFWALEIQVHATSSRIASDINSYGSQNHRLSLWINKSIPWIRISFDFCLVFFKENVFSAIFNIHSHYVLIPGSWIHIFCHCSKIFSYIYYLMLFFTWRNNVKKSWCNYFINTYKIKKERFLYIEVYQIFYPHCK